MLESKLLTFLWKRNCLKWGETNIAVFRHHVPLHAILYTKWFFANGTEPTHVNSSGAECIDWENCSMLRIDIVLKAIKFYSFPPPPPPQFYCFPPPPPPHFYCFSSTTTTTATTFLLFSLHRHHISIVSPPPPHFYCFPSTTTTTTFLLFSLHHHHHHRHHISIVFPPPPPPPPPPPHFYCFPSSFFYGQPVHNNCMH